MLHNHHAVRVTIRGYKKIASFASMLEAIDFVIKQPVSAMGIVYRDGTTGKRYSQKDCIDLINAPTYKKCSMETVRENMKRIVKNARK